MMILRSGRGVTGCWLLPLESFIFDSQCSSLPIRGRPLLLGELAALLQGTSDEAADTDGYPNKPSNEQKNAIRAEIPVETPSNQGSSSHFETDCQMRLAARMECPMSVEFPVVLSWKRASGIWLRLTTRTTTA